ADGGEPAPRWRQDVCEVRETTTPGVRESYPLLTLAGPNLVYGSEAGVLVALNGLTGQRVWALRYPRQGGRPAEGEAADDLTPCVCANGRLYAAPEESDRLLCLDPVRGRVLWENDRVEGVPLLGVVDGRLVFTTPQGIRAVGADSGSGAGGWAQPSTGSLTSMGRGFLADGLVFWPTLEQQLWILNA